MHARPRGRSVLMAGARHDYKLGQPDQILPAVPAGDFGESVGADDEVRLLAHGADLLHRIHRVTLGLSRFQPRRNKSWINLARQLCHPEAIFISCAGMIGLMRWMSGRNEPYFIQVKLRRSLARHREVSVMDGIESAAEKGQSHDLVLPASPFPPGFV